MENYITLFIATLHHLELITEKEAEKLDKELRNTTIPATFKEAQILVKNTFEKIRK